MTPGFTEDWLCAESCAYLADLAAIVAGIPGLIVEIGSWEGRSTVTLANAVAPRTVHAVDTWKGSPGEVSAELAATRDVHAQFRANIEAFTAGNVEDHICGWRDWLPSIDEPVAFVFIDAEHSYCEVFDTIEAFKPLLTPGGIICGDDVLHPPVGQAVSAALDPFQVEVREGASLWAWRKP
jgi:predicted O-methyltransferase YrrM